MVSIDELYKPEDLGRINHDDMISLTHLHYKLNCLRYFYQQPMTISSGFRTIEEQIALYKKLAKPVVLGSQHLTGSAVDISDPRGDLKKFILKNMRFMEEQFLFMESFTATGGLETGWVHLQLFPYGSWQPGMTHFFQP